MIVCDMCVLWCVHTWLTETGEEEAWQSQAAAAAAAATAKFWAASSKWQAERPKSPSLFFLAIIILL